MTKERFKLSTFDFANVLLAYLRSKGLSVREILEWDENYYTDSCCYDTCDMNQYEVTVTYIDDDNHSQRYIYYGMFSSLIIELEGLEV